MSTRVSLFTLAWCGVLTATSLAQGILNGAGGAEPSSQFGASIAAISDVDGDGVGDLAVGAPLEDAGFADRGVTRVFSGASGAVTQSLLGSAANARFGTTVAAIGDINADGVPDFAVAAPGAGLVSVRSGTNGGQIWSAPCSAAPAFLGFPALVCGIGDVDGNGVPDVAIGRPGTKLVDVRRGQNGGLIHTITAPTSGGDFAGFGSVVSAAGDLDFDGVLELAIGAPTATSSALAGNGAVHVARGDTGAPIRTLFGGAAGDQFGGALALVGDADLDFVEDLAVGSPGSSTFKPAGGLAEIRSGANGLPSWILLPPAANARFGASVSAAGLLDANNAFDFAIGAPGVRRVSVYSGAFAIPLYDVTFDLAPGFGDALTFPGDLNLDGVGDILAGASGAGTSGKGAVYVISGQCGLSQSYGSSCKGPFAAAPQLAFGGCPAPLGILTISISGVQPGAFGFVLTSGQPGNIPLVGGCTSLLQQIFPGIFPFVADGAGNAAFVGQIPLGLTGADRRFQAFVPGLGGAVATTNGVRLTVQ